MSYYPLSGVYYPGGGGLSVRMILETAENTSHGERQHIRLRTLRLSGSEQYGLACTIFF